MVCPQELGYPVRVRLCEELHVARQRPFGGVRPHLGEELGHVGLGHALQVAPDPPAEVLVALPTPWYVMTMG